MSSKTIKEEKLKKISAGSTPNGPLMALAIIEAINGGVSKEAILSNIARYREDFTKNNVCLITQKFMDRFGEDPFTLI